MDGFIGYNYIKMALDAEETNFSDSYGNFFHTVMPFVPENVDATYQCVVATIFDDMMYNCLEDYVDDIVGKSKEVCTL